MKQDITEHKHMEKDLRRNLEELERFNKLANGREIKMIQLKEEIKNCWGNWARVKSTRLSKFPDQQI